jgi:hypothetical protein
MPLCKLLDKFGRALLVKVRHPPVYRLRMIFVFQFPPLCRVAADSYSFAYIRGKIKDNFF